MGVKKSGWKRHIWKRKWVKLSNCTHFQQKLHKFTHIFVTSTNSPTTRPVFNHQRVFLLVQVHQARPFVFLFICCYKTTPWSFCLRKVSGSCRSGRWRLGGGSAAAGNPVAAKWLGSVRKVQPLRACAPEIDCTPVVAGNTAQGRRSVAVCQSNCPINLKAKDARNKSCGHTFSIFSENDVKDWGFKDAYFNNNALTIQVVSLSKSNPVTNTFSPSLLIRGSIYHMQIYIYI